MKTLVAIGVLGLAGLCVASAQAAGRQPKTRGDAASPEQPGTEPAKAKENAAKKACLTGDPIKGVELLTDLFIETDDPNYIFNQGRCYEQSSRYEEAIERFREYLRKAKTAGPTERAEAEKHIAECKAVLDGKAQSSTPKSHGDVRPSAPEPAAVPLASAGSDVDRSALVQAAPASTPALAGSGLRVGGIVVAAAGLAAVGAGVALNLKHNSIIRDMRENYDQSTHASAGDYRTWAIVGYAAGAACIAGGAIMYALGWKRGRGAVALSASADGAELAIRGRF